MSTTDGPAPLSASPTEGQLIQHAGRTYETIREGKAFILSPPNTRKSVDPQAQSKGGRFWTCLRSHFNRANALLSCR